MTAWTVLLDQHRQSWAPGHCTLSGAWVGGEPVGKMAAMPSPAGRGPSVLSREAACPERPWAGRVRGQAAVTWHPQARRQDGESWAWCLCSLEGSHCLSFCRGGRGSPMGLKDSHFSLWEFLKIPEPGREVQEGGDICTPMAGSC